MSFKKGDLVFGRSFNGYSITNERMVVGLVTDAYGTDSDGYTNMKVTIIRHLEPFNEGFQYTVTNSDSRFTKVPISILKNINGMDTQSIFDAET